MNQTETTRQLRVNLNDQERIELGRQLAQSSQRLETIAEDKKAANAQFKADQSAAEAKVASLSQQIANGYRLDTVKCVWLLDTPEVGKKQLVRMDTKESIETLTMIDADKQQNLPLADPDGGTTVKTTVDSDPESGVVKVAADEDPEND
jgi:anti-sigma28 factor (negative regulator of flagellin synthesis)